MAADRSGDLPAADELLSTPAVVVRGELDAMSAVAEMTRNEVHYLAVISGDSPMGLVTSVDLMFGIAGRLPGDSATVESLCRRPAPHVQAKGSAGLAARRMIEAKSDALLVLAGDEVVGVLTALDLVRTLFPSKASDDAGGRRG